MSGFSFSPARFARRILGSLSGVHGLSDDTLASKTFKLCDNMDAIERNNIGNTTTEFQQEESHEYPEMNLSPIDELPVEVFEKVLEYLSIEDLKACRLVCRTWPRRIHHHLLYRSRLYQNVFQLKEQESTELGEYMSHSGLPLNHHTLRLSGFMFTRHPIPPYFYKWLNRINMSTVVSLELVDSQLHLASFFQLLSSFVNLEKLTLSYGTLLLHTCNAEIEQNDLMNRDLQEFGQCVVNRIQALLIHSSQPSPHEILRLLNASEVTCYSKLRELDLRGDCGIPNFQLGKMLSQIFTANRNIFKILKLDANLLRKSLDSAFVSKDIQAREHLPSEFRAFLREIDAFGWSKCGLDLLELSLERFGVAAMDDEQVDIVFYPFLRSLPNMQKFTFAHAYFFSNEAEGADRLLSNLPPDCQLNLTSTHVYDHNARPEGFDQLIRSHNNILIYQGTSVELKFGNVCWRILYCTWNSMMDQPVLLKWAMILTKFKLTNAQFSLGDKELQYIISECPRLTLLHLDQCDLHDLTDFGVTGLSKAALHQAYMAPGPGAKTNFLANDLTGVPISSLRDLRSLTLSDVGEKMTNLSISAGFMNLPHLQELVIRQWPMTLSSSALKSLCHSTHVHLEYCQPLTVN